MAAPPLRVHTDRLVACVEVGGSGVQTVLFEPGRAEPRFLDGAHRPAGAALRIAVPGVIGGGRVLGASNLGWYDVDPAEMLGLAGTAELVLNDAEAAALGEAALRSLGAGSMAYLCLGTGVGCAVVSDGQVIATELLGHGSVHSDRVCNCKRVGCLETVAAGWALPTGLVAADLDTIARHLTDAIGREPRLASTSRLVVGGGIIGDHPSLRDRLQSALTASPRAGRPWRVEPSAARRPAKSAAAFGLLAYGTSPLQLTAPSAGTTSEVIQ